MRPIRGDGTPLIVLRRAINVVGRNAGCDVVLDAGGVSKRHCVLVKTDGLLWLRDLASTNGVFVNGTRAVSGALLPGDRIRIGPFRFRVYLAAAESDADSTSRARFAAATAEGGGAAFAAEDASSIPTAPGGAIRGPGALFETLDLDEDENEGGSEDDEGLIELDLDADQDRW